MATPIPKRQQQQLTSSLVDIERKLSNKELRLLLADYHDIFIVNDDECGETDSVEIQMDTGEAYIYPRRVLFSAHKEVPRQLEKIQKDNVIQPSENSWANPDV